MTYLPALASIHMWEYPAFVNSWVMRPEDPHWTPQRQPWLYRPTEDNHPWFDHHERGLNRTMIYNMTSGPALIGSYI